MNDEIYRLRSVNDAIGEYLRNDLTEEIKKLQEVISTQGSTIESENETKIKEVLGNLNITEYKKEEDEFYTDEELNTDLQNASYPQEFKSIQSALITYKGTYNSIYDNTYKSSWDIYNGLEMAQEKAKYTDETGIKTQISALDAGITLVDETVVHVNQLESRHYRLAVSQYKQKAVAALNDLKSNLQSLKSFYETILPVYQAAASSVSANTKDSSSIQDILAFMYTSEHNKSQQNSTNIDEIQKFLSSRQELILNGGQSNKNGIDVEQLNNLEDFQEAFNDYVKYVELRDDIDKFIEDDLNTTYYIKGENETDLPASDDNIKVVSEDHWVKERKQHFSKFISFVKSLPDVDVDGDVENLKELELVSNYYSDSEQVLQSAYTINRDLLEDISGFEKAMNYFKYDFSLMAVFALAMALFLDVASFLTGVFMFGAGFFQCKEKQDQKHDSTKNGA